MIVYTAIIGKEEKLYAPSNPGHHSFICFTDLPIKSDVWEIRKVHNIPEDGRLQARWLKTHPEELFPKETESVWIDANMHLLANPDEIILKARGFELVGLVHPKNDDLLQEADQINASLKIPWEDLGAQIQRFQAQGFELPNYVTSTGFLYRRHTPSMRVFHDIWWKEILVCVRDQMSVDYAAWAAGIRTRHFAGHFRNNDFFQYFTHGGKQAILRPRNLTRKFGRRFLS